MGLLHKFYISIKDGLLLWYTHSFANKDADFIDL